MTIKGLDEQRAEIAQAGIKLELAARFEAVERAARRVREYGEEIARYAAAEETLSFIYAAPNNPPNTELAHELERLRDAVKWVKTLMYATGNDKDATDALIEECKGMAIANTRTIAQHVFTVEAETAAVAS